MNIGQEVWWNRECWVPQQNAKERRQAKGEVVSYDHVRGVVCVVEHRDMSDRIFFLKTHQIFSSREAAAGAPT